MRGTTLQTLRSVVNGEEEVLHVLAVEILLQPMEAHGDAEIHLQPLETPTPEQVDVPEGAVTPWEALAGAGS